MLKNRKKPEAGEYDETATSARIVYPRNGLERENAELLLEIGDRTFEAMPGGAHGFGPIGDRRSGKRKVSAKSRILKK
jgi:hypothetical protein